MPYTFQRKYYLAAERKKSRKWRTIKVSFRPTFTSVSNIFFLEFVSLYFSRITCYAKRITTAAWLQREKKETFMKSSMILFSSLVFSIVNATDEFECNSNGNQTSCKIKRIIRTRISIFTKTTTRMLIFFCKFYHAWMKRRWSLNCEAWKE